DGAATYVFYDPDNAAVQGPNSAAGPTNRSLRLSAQATMQDAAGGRYAANSPLDSSSGCDTNGPLFLTNFVAYLTAYQNASTQWLATERSFNVFGGTNGVAYSFYRSGDAGAAYVTTN